MFVFQLPAKNRGMLDPSVIALVTREIFLSLIFDDLSDIMGWMKHYAVF